MEKLHSNPRHPITKSTRANFQHHSTRLAQAWKPNNFCNLRSKRILSICMRTQHVHNMYNHITLYYWVAVFAFACIFMYFQDASQMRLSRLVEAENLPSCAHLAWTGPRSSKFFRWLRSDWARYCCHRQPVWQPTLRQFFAFHKQNQTNPPTPLWRWRRAFWGAIRLH